MKFELLVATRYLKAKRKQAVISLITVISIIDRKSTRLNSSHLGISYAVFCLKKKKKTPCVSLRCAGRGPPPFSESRRPTPVRPGAPFWRRADTTYLSPPLLTLLPQCVRLRAV